MVNKDTDLIFEAYKGINEDLGLGHSTPKMIRVPGPGSQNTASKIVVMKISDEEENPTPEDETVYIQAGEKEEGCGCDTCNGGHDDDYDGELDMARAELLKANEYSAKLFDMIGNLDSLEGWTASKITKAADYLSSVFHYLDYESMEANVEDEEDTDEDKIEVDEFDGTQTAKNTGFAGA